MRGATRGSMTSISLRCCNHFFSCHSCVAPCNAPHATIARAICVRPYCRSGLILASPAYANSRRTRAITDTNENDASLLPGNIPERTFIELCAANSDVEVMYSLR